MNRFFPSQKLLTIRGNPWPFLLSLLCLGFYAYHLFSLTYIVDDSYISFRYLDNFIAGKGLVFNPGERVEGYSNFLWIMALAPLRWLGLKAETAAMLLSITSYLILCWSVSKATHLVTGDLKINQIHALILPVLLLTGSTHLAAWSVSGMETVFFSMLLSVGTTFILLQKPLRGAFIFSLLALTRPEGIALGAISLFLFFCYQLMARDSLVRTMTRALLALIVFVTPVGLHLLFRYNYYGEIFPNTYFVKLTGNESNLVAVGLEYLGGYLSSGGLFLLIPGLLSLLFIFSTKNKLKAGALFFGPCILIVQSLFYMVYAVMVGGDYFPFHRFLAPTIPALCILTAYALLSGYQKILAHPRPKSIVPRLTNPLLIGVIISLCQVVIANTSAETKAHQILRSNGEERKLIGNWLKANYSDQKLLAINAAGLIPYITKMPTIDMLGLNDATIARQPVRPNVFGGASFVGHLKHDGDYVCNKKPDLILTAGARLNNGRSAVEASYQAALNTFEGDREFLNSKDCENSYETRVEELSPGKFLVIYQKIPEGKVGVDPFSSRDNSLSGPTRGKLAAEPEAKVWFERGMNYMARANLIMAIRSFEESLKLNPDSVPARINLAYSYLDFKKPREALEHFNLLGKRHPDNYEVLYGLALATEKYGEKQSARILWARYIKNAPDSVWKEKARRNLKLLDD